MSRRLVVEVELLDSNATWQDDEMENLAERIRQTLTWHGIAQQEFCELGKITARKEATE
jgi:hypothetical protein